MNENQLKLLKSLRSAFTSQKLDVVENSEARKHLRQAEMIAIHLLLELEETPKLRRHAMQAYALLVPDIEKCLADRDAAIEVVKNFNHITKSDDASRFEACLESVCKIEAELQRIASEQSGSLQKRLVEVEGNYSRQIQALFASATAPLDGDQPASDVGQSKIYDTKKLRDFIASSFPGEANVKIIESRFLSGGNSKYTLAIRLDGVSSLPQEVILRGDSELSAQMGGISVTDEFRLLSVLYPQGVCVPKPLALEPGGAIFGNPFMLVERRPGRMIGHMFDLPPANAEICRDTGAKLAGVHRVPIAEVGDWVRGANELPSTQTAITLEQSLASWRALQKPSPVIDTAFAWLKRNVAIMDRTRGLVHGDYGLNNLLIDGEKITAILDWEFSHIGNPAYDLGYFYFQAEHMSSWQDFLAAYQAAGGILPSQEEIDFAIVFAATRLAVMVGQGGASFFTMPSLSLQLALVSACYMHETSVDRLGRALERVL